MLCVCFVLTNGERKKKEKHSWKGLIVESKAESLVFTVVINYGLSGKTSLASCQCWEQKNTTNSLRNKEGVCV